MVCGSIGDDLLQALLPAGCRRPGLRVLWLINAGLSGRSLLHLARACELPSLLELDLSGNALQGFADFVTSPLARNLRVLNLTDTTEIGVGGFQAMLAATAFPVLSEVCMDGVDHEIEFVLDALRDRYGDRIRF